MRLRDVGHMGRLPDTSEQVSGWGRLPDTSEQISRLPDTSEQVNGISRLPSDGVERMAGGLGRMGAMGAAAPRPAPALAVPPSPRSIEMKPDVRKAINNAMTTASVEAKKATVLKEQAVLALKMNERRTAGVKAVQAMQAQRRAEQSADSAKRTASVLQLEKRAAELESEAAKLDSSAVAQAALRGESGTTLATRAKARLLITNAKRLRAQAAMIAAAKPAQIGASDARIAQVASKFDVRTRRNEAISRKDDAILLATLQGIEDEAGYDSSLTSGQSAADAYGNDQMGQALAAAELGDLPRFIAVLQGLDGQAIAPKAIRRQRSVVSERKRAMVSGMSTQQLLMELMDGAKKSFRGGAFGGMDDSAKIGFKLGLVELSRRSMNAGQRKQFEDLIDFAGEYKIMGAAMARKLLVGPGGMSPPAVPVLRSAPALRRLLPPR